MASHTAIDASGVTRHIARQTFRHPILNEPTTPRDWQWVVRSLWRPTNAASPDKCQATLIDTLVIDAAAISGWYFTSKDGNIMKKSEKNCTADQIKATFAKAAEAYAKPTAPYAVVYSSDGRQQVCVV